MEELKDDDRLRGSIEGRAVAQNFELERKEIAWERPVQTRGWFVLVRTEMRRLALLWSSG